LIAATGLALDPDWGIVMTNVITSTPAHAPIPIGPYSHVAKVGALISIGGVAGVDPKTGTLGGSDVGAQTSQILNNMSILLESAASDLGHVVHVNVFLLHMSDFDEMNRVYAECMGAHRPARTVTRTVIGVNELPKPGALLTMNLTAAVRD
jgi:2-iminobutanoate/2-iminopropanoate deaminase